MRAVTRAMLDDMPDPCDLHLERAEGRCLVMVGSAVLSEYAGSDVVMRNFAVTTMRLAGFSGKRVAEVFRPGAEGRCLVMVGSAVLSEYAGSDVVMRNFAVTTMRLAGFSGKRVAEVF